MRGFARDIGLPASRLSELLRAKRHLSVRSAVRVAQKLGLSASETELLLREIAKAQAAGSVSVGKRQPRPPGTPPKLQKARLTDSTQLTDSAGPNLTLDVFAIVSDWVHYAVLELAGTVGFKSDADWIARRLSISRSETELAIERLIKVGMLGRDKRGRLLVLEEHSISPSDVPSEAIRRHHRQLMRKADNALDFVALEEREISTTIFAIATKDLPQAKAELREFRRRFGIKLTGSKNKNRVYSLGIQLIPLDVKKDSHET